MQDKFMVSVRFMTYMHEAFVRQAMESVLMQQTDFPVEIVVGDDFSTDKTLEIIRSCSETKNIKIRVLQRERGDQYDQVRQARGRLYNFVNIIHHCQGKYIAILDGDDYWTDPQKLQKQVDYLESNPEVVCCFHGYDALEEDGTITPGQNPVPVVVSGLACHRIHVPTLTAVFRNVIQQFPDSFYESPHGDKYLWGLLSRKGAFARLAFKGAVYRQHTGGVYSGLRVLGRAKNAIKTRMLLAYHLGGKDRYALKKNAKRFAWRGFLLALRKRKWQDSFYFFSILISQPDGYFIHKVFGTVWMKMKPGNRK